MSAARSRRTDPGPGGPRGRSIDGSLDGASCRLGRVVFSTLAQGLTTPSLALNAPALPDGVVIKPDGPVQNYLAGTAALPLRPQLTGEVLRDAGVVPSCRRAVVPSWAGMPEPGQVVSSIQTYFSVAGSSPPPAGDAGFIIQTYDPSRPAYRAFATRDEMQAELARQRRHELYGGALDDLKQSLEDLWQGVKSGAAKIAQVAYDAAERAVAFSVMVAGKAVDLFKIFLRSFRDAADATMALFNQLNAAIQNVVAWLQSLFNLKDIWDTKTALEVDGFGRFPGYIRAELLAKLGPDKLKNQLNQHRANAIGALHDFAKRFAGRKVQDLPGWGQISAAPRPAPEAVLFATPRGAVRRGDVEGPPASWLLDSVLPYDASVPLGPMVPSLEPAWAGLRDALGKVDFSFADEFKDRFAALFDPDDPSSLGAVVLDALVAVLTWVIDQGFDAAIFVAEALYHAIDQVLQKTAQFLSTPVEFQPLVELVNWVYREAHAKGPTPPPPPAVTLAGLVSLVVAFPVTLAYKLAVGDANSPLFSGGRLPRPRQGPAPGAAAGGMTAGQRCLLAGGIIRLCYTGLDITNDIESSHVSSLGAIVTEFLMPLLIWPTPDGVPFSSETTETPDQQFYRWFNWAPGLVYFAADALFFFVGWKVEKKLARESEPLGKIVLWRFGTLNLIAGVGETVATRPTVTGAGIAANLLSPLSPAAQILRISPKPHPYLLAIKLATNVLSDTGGGLARVLAAGGK